MYQPPPYPPPPGAPPPQRRGFLGFGIGGAVVLVALGVLGTFARIQNRKHDAEVKEKKATLPAVGSEGTLAKGPSSAALCAVPRNAFNFGWPCPKTEPVPRDSKVRIMKAGMSGTDAVCRYWVQGGPRDNASGDAPCEWFAAH